MSAVIPFSSKTDKAMDQELATVAEILEIDPAKDDLSGFVVLAYPKHGSWHLSFDDGKYSPVYRSNVTREYAVQLASRAAMAWGATLIVQSGPWPECSWERKGATKSNSHSTAFDEPLAEFDDPEAALLPAHFVAPSPAYYGQRVQHPKFGLGTVAMVESDFLAVDFDKVGRRRIVHGFVTPTDAPSGPSGGHAA